METLFWIIGTLTVIFGLFAALARLADKLEEWIPWGE